MIIFLCCSKHSVVGSAYALRNLGYSVFFDPIFEQVQVCNSIKLDSKKFDFYIFTSVSGIEFAPSCLDKKTKLLLVGSKTMDFGVQSGFNNIEYCGINAEDLNKYLLKRIPSNGLYIRGEEISFDFKNEFNKLHNFNYIDDLIVYKIIPKNNLSSKTIDLFKNNKINIIFFYSFNTAKIFIDLITKENLLNSMKNIISVSISHKIISAFSHVSFKKNLIANEPNLKSMIDKIAENQEIY